MTIWIRRRWFRGEQRVAHRLRVPSRGDRGGWSLSNTIETGLCVEAMENALTHTGHVPGIFNTDQGCEFTSAEWIGRLSGLGVKISMDAQIRLFPTLSLIRHP